MSGAVLYSDTDSDGNIPFSEVTTFSCMDGYGLVGARTSTCDEDGGTPPSGVFSPIPPTCEREYLLYHTSLTVKWSFAAICRILQKFVLNLIPFTHTAITCSQLDMLIDGMIVYNPQPLLDESLSYGTVATHNCDSVHLLVGSFSRTCTGDDTSTEGYFDGNEPFCQGV